MTTNEAVKEKGNVKVVSTDLVKIREMNPLKLFKPNGLTPLLEAIREEVIHEVHDVNTPKGRDGIKALCTKITGSRGVIKEIGKTYADELRARLNPITAENTRGETNLTDLKTEVRKPLTEWEDAEKKRIKDLDKKLQEIIFLANERHPNGKDVNADELKANLVKLEEIEIGEDIWQEKTEEANQTILETLDTLKKVIVRREKYEAEQIELEELRIKNEKAEKEAEERRIADAAREEAEAATARAEADKKAAEERAVQAEKDKELAELRVKELAEERVIQDELNRKAAEERAKAEAEESARIAVEEEKKRQAEAQRQEEEVELARQNDVNHRKKINQEILGYLKNEQSYPEEAAKDIIRQIASGDWPHISIKY